MEELLVFALLLDKSIVTQKEYAERLDELFLCCPQNDDLLYLEWETNVKNAVAYIKTHVDCRTLDDKRFGKILMEKIKRHYEKNPDLKTFSARMYRLWQELPEQLKHKEPFFTLCYADDPLSWGDEKQTRELYESMMNHYED